MAQYQNVRKTALQNLQNNLDEVTKAYDDEITTIRNIIQTKQSEQTVSDDLNKIQQLQERLRSLQQ